MGGESSPTSKVTKPREPRGRVRFLDEEEREKLLFACKVSSNSFLHTMVVIALSTGTRLSEIISLSWNDVDLDKGRVILYETKNGDIRQVAITGHALELLKIHDKYRRLDTDLLFPGRYPKKPIDIRSAWNAAVKRPKLEPKLEDLRFHDLRHSCASYLAMNGASLSEIAEVPGHKTLSMVKRFAHLSDNHTAGVLARMNDKIFGEV